MASESTELQKRLAGKAAEGAFPGTVLLVLAWALSGQFDQLNARLDKVSASFATLQSEVKALELSAAGDRWTATQHREFEARISDQFRRLDARIDDLEDSQRRRK